MKTSALSAQSAVSVWLRTSLAAAALVAPVALCQADTVIGLFSAPVLTGNTVALDGSPVFFDNTGTAFSSIVNSVAQAPAGSNQQSVGSLLLWGANPSSSSLIFFGKTVPADPYQPFDLGTLTYFNGTSQLSSLIFGATLSFTAAAGEANGASQIGIVTTSNLATAGSQQHDADYITLSGLANTSFNVYEGSSATVELFGKFVDDPIIQLTSLALNPGQAGSAFLGDGSPVPVPETTNFLAGLAMLGLVGFELFRRKARPLAV